MSFIPTRKKRNIATMQFLRPIDLARNPPLPRIPVGCWEVVTAPQNRFVVDQNNHYIIGNVSDGLHSSFVSEQETLGCYWLDFLFVADGSSRNIQRNELTKNN